MKYLVFGFFVLNFTISCTSDSNATAEERKVEFAEFIDNPTTITFENDTYDFGTVTEGEMVRHVYKFTNTGNQNLILIDVNGTCGCTVPEDWPKNPIAPGESGEITVVFNSNQRVGNVLKNVRVNANTEPMTTTTLTLKGVVKAK